MIIGRQSEDSLIRGFDNLVLTLTLTLGLCIYSTYMTAGLTDLRIIDTLPTKSAPLSHWHHNTANSTALEATAYLNSKKTFD